MGLGASQARLMALTARKSDLELQLQFINQSRMMIANIMGSLAQQMTQQMGQVDVTQGQLQGDMAKKMMFMYEQRMTVIQQMDKMLEMQANRVNTQHQAVQTEIEAVQKVISKNIEMSFKLMA